MTMFFYCTVTSPLTLLARIFTAASRPASDTRDRQSPLTVAHSA